MNEQPLRTRDRHIRLMLSQEEALRVEAEARRLGLSVAGWIRSVIFERLGEQE